MLISDKDYIFVGCVVGKFIVSAFQKCQTPIMIERNSFYSIRPSKNQTASPARKGSNLKYAYPHG